MANPNSNVLISAPPKETPFLSRDGRVSEPWLYWLQSVTATGVVVQNLQSLQIIAEDNSTDANTGHIISELLDAISLLAEPRRVFESADEYSFIPNARPADDVPDADPRLVTVRAELDELRMLVDALPVQGRSGATGSFTTADAKTVTVTDGVITSIV